MRRTLLFLSSFVLAVIALPNAGGQTSVETELLGLINDARENKVTMHSGLRIVAREHSREMSDDNELGHHGAEDRIARAQPDPSEPNGAPDDGFTGTWCENVAYVRGAPEHEVAQRIFEGWTNSASHYRCMHNEEINTAGVGLYFDGDRTYWATYESAVDRTAPGSARVTPSPTPTPSAAPIVPTLRRESPEPSQTPEPSESPTQTPEEDLSASPEPTTSATPDVLVRGTTSGTPQVLPAPVVPSATKATFGWGQLGLTLGAIGALAEALRRLTRRSDQS